LDEVALKRKRSTPGRKAEAYLLPLFGATPHVISCQNVVSAGELNERTGAREGYGAVRVLRRNGEQWDEVVLDSLADLLQDGLRDVVAKDVRAQEEVPWMGGPARS